MEADTLTPPSAGISALASESHSCTEGYFEHVHNSGNRCQRGSVDSELGEISHRNGSVGTQVRSHPRSQESRSISDHSQEPPWTCKSLFSSWGTRDGLARLGRSTKRSVWLILTRSWLNIFLVAAPIGIILDYTHQPASAIFPANCLAIIPLTMLLAYATESVADNMGDAVGALLNITFGNAVEIIIL